MWNLITLLVWLPLATLWFALVALIVRLWGIRLPIFWWNADPVSLRALRRWQHVIVEGVLKYGMGSWLMLSSADYIACRFEYHPASCETVRFFFISLAGCMFMGLLVGLSQWARLGRQRLASPD